MIKRILSSLKIYTVAKKSVLYALTFNGNYLRHAQYCTKLAADAVDITTVRGQLMKFITPESFVKKAL